MSRALDEGQEALVAFGHQQGWIGEEARVLARKYRGLVEEPDLVGLGAIGLADAAARYQDDRGPFEYYAKKRIKGAMRDGIRLVATEARRERSAETGADMVLTSLEQAPKAVRHDPNELVERLGSLADQVLAGAFVGLLREVEREPEQQLASRQEYSRALAALAEASSRLNPRDRRLLEQLFDEPPLTIEAAADVHGVNYKTIARWRNRALEVMRHALVARGVTRAPAPMDVGPSARHEDVRGTPRE